MDGNRAKVVERVVTRRNEKEKVIEKEGNKNQKVQASEGN